MKKTRKQWYTVVLEYPLCMQTGLGVDTYIEWAFETCAEDAVRTVQQKAAEAQNDGDCDIVDEPEMFAPIAVFKGRLTSEAI